MKLTNELRRKNQCRAIELAYGSLKTHYREAIKGKNPAFDAEAIREYAEIILICAQENEILAIEHEADRQASRAAATTPEQSAAEKL